MSDGHFDPEEEADWDDFLRAIQDADRSIDEYIRENTANPGSQRSKDLFDEYQEATVRRDAVRERISARRRAK